METFFAVEALEVTRLADPVVCPARRDLRCTGVAVDLDHGFHLVMQLGSLEFWMGPDRSTVERRAAIVQAATPMPALMAALMHDWVLEVWEAAVDVRVESILGKGTPV